MLSQVEASLLILVSHTQANGGFADENEKTIMMVATTDQTSVTPTPNAWVMNWAIAVSL